MRSVSSALIVDDNSLALQTFGQLLRALGVDDICEASSAEEALEIVTSRKFAVILCDYRMEGLDGVQFVERIRQRGDQTPVIMLSGAADKTGVIRATQYPGVDFFAKPFEIGELTGAMERMAEAA
jgi:CheY-like chemotaxis protein